MRTKHIRTLQSLLFFSLLLAGSTALFAQNMNLGFGKNRVQYHRQFEEWQYYDTPHFSTYWYGDARNIAVTALQMAEYDYFEISQILEYQMNERVELLVFSDLSDLKQSNIGADDLFMIKIGETKVSGSKVFVYYDGDHNHLRQSIREGLAGIMINSMLLGGNLQEIVQNSVLLNLPGWYTDGLKSYCGQAWSTSLDEQLRTLLLSGKYTDFDKLAKAHPSLAGHAFWQYIAYQFGGNAVSNLLYLTRINRGLDAGFRYVMGNGYEKTTDVIFEYYNKRYQEDSRLTSMPEKQDQVKIKNKRKLPLYSPAISPDGRRIAWVQNDIGKWKVWMKDLRTGKKHLMLRGGSRNALQATDYGYPMLSWSPDNATLGVIYEKRDVAKLALIDAKTRKKDIRPVSPEFQRVHSAHFINPADMVFSATVRGYTDIFIYHTINRQSERITNDFWDDRDASLIRLDGKRYLAFSSNRTGDTLAQQRIDSVLAIGPSDIFLYDLDTRSNELIRVTNTPLAHERLPIQGDSAHLVWISDKNGIDNLAAAYLEDYTAYNKITFYLKNGTEIAALDTKHPGEWPLEKALLLLTPADTVQKNLDSLSIDSLVAAPVLKKRAVSWLETRYTTAINGFDISGSSSPKIVKTFRTGKGITSFYVQPLPPLAYREPAYPMTNYRKQTFRAAGLQVPEFSGKLDETDTRQLESKVGNRDSIPNGWYFQIPEYWAAPSPEPGNPAIPELKPERSEASSGTEQSWNARMLSRREKFVRIGNRKPAIHHFNPSRIVPYRLKFRTDFVSTTMDNSLLFEGLNSYAGSPGGFRTPPPGVLLRANFKELLENYVIEAGFRLPTSFNGSEYYLLFDDRKRRIDRRYALYRKTQVSTLEGGAPGTPSQLYQARTNTLLGQYELRYPVDPFFSIRGMATLRQDKTLTLTSDRNTLETPDYSEQRAAVRLSAVYDNTVDVDINLKTGSRARVFVEAVKRFEFNTQPNVQLKFNSGFMTVLNLDARHYQRLDKHSILALRVAGATTFGSERILYYLGGVDNWILPKFNSNIPVPQNENFAYETLAAHLRGFRQNIRNGSSYALLNSELRIPVFKYFSQKPVLGSFWRNFQLVGFFDAGSAWTGSSPYNGDNPINIVYLENPPTVQVKVNYFRDPLVAGYGAGLRMQLFGLFLRADYAWGIETRKVQKPMLHIALGADF